MVVRTHMPKHETLDFTYDLQNTNLPSNYCLTPGRLADITEVDVLIGKKRRQKGKEKKKKTTSSLELLKH